MPAQREQTQRHAFQIAGLGQGLARVARVASEQARRNRQEELFDQPGRFLQWLYLRKPVKTFEIKGQWLDIGSKETLEAADKMFSAASAPKSVDVAL